jgi:transposase InsO family protein
MSAAFPKLTLPRDWPKSVKSAFVCAVAMARVALVQSRGRCSNSPIARVRLAAENERLESEVALLREELRIKDARLGRIPPANRPHYPPTERLAILALKAARGWNNAQTGRAFLLTDVTIASWLKRIDESGSDALVKLPEPVNRFPDFVRQVVQQLRCVCPTMGKVRVAQMLARAGLRLSPSTVRRFLRRPLGPKLPSSNTARDVAECNESAKASVASSKRTRTIVAKYPHHVLHLDFTIVPTHFGFWVPWFPFACVQCWPFAYCVAVLVDHFSCKAITSAAFKNWPSSRDTTDWLDVIIRSIGRKPKYIITDQGPQFGEEYEDWCAARGIKPRFGAVGQHGSIAIVERFILSLKNECTRRIIVPLRLDAFQAEFANYFRWYNEVRPHQSLGGRTPNEVYLGIPSARDGPRFETRLGILKSMGRRKRRHEVVATSDLALVVDCLEGRRHLPVVTLKHAD